MAQEVNTITITGSARVAGLPDQAVITLGVSERAESAAAAMAANSAALTRVIDSLRAAGVAERDMQTSQLNLGPEWHHGDGSAPPKLLGYSVSNMLTVTVRDLTIVGAVLDAAVKDGANRLHGLSFGMSNPAPLLDEAHVKAVEAAKARAALLTKAAGQSLGQVLSIREGADHSGGPMPMLRMAAPEMDVPVMGGEIEYNAQVTITWEIAPEGGL